MIHLLMRFLPQIKRAFGRFNRSEIPVRAAALAYHTLLGIVPIVGLIFWYLHRIRLTDHWLAALKDFMTSQLNVSSSAVFLQYFDRLTLSVQGESWGWIGLGLLLYTAWNLVAKFGEAVDIILSTSLTKPGIKIGGLKLAFRRVSVMLALPVALTISLALSNWIRSGSLLHTLLRLKTVGPAFALPFAWSTTITAIFLVYYLIPSHPVRWKEALKAALIVGPASEIIRLLFGIYNQHAVSTYKIYGVLAVIPLFILWIQLSWMVLLSGTMLMRFSGPLNMPGD
jgi:membrane protein